MSTAVRVGLFMTVCLLVLGYFILRIEDFDLFARGNQKIDAVFDSVAGLDDKAAVRVAGVRIGRVDGVGLEGARARVTLRLEQPLALTQGTTASIATAGLLGEKYVELVPGPPGAPALPPGTVLQGTTPITFDQAMAKLNDVADGIRNVTGSLAGEGGDTPVSRLIANLEAVSAEIRDLVQANKAQVNATVGNFERFSATLADELPKLTRQIERVMAQVDSVLAENRENLKGSMENIREVTDRVQTSVDNLNRITGRIASGQGTIGKLVNSDEAHSQLMSALNSVDSGVKSLSDTLGRVQKLKLDLGIEGAYLSGLDESRTVVGMNLDPQSGKFYHVEIVDDPRGKRRDKTQVITTTQPDGTVDRQTIHTLTTENQTTLSAQFGFKMGDARLRAGLFESRGGAAVDYGFLKDRLWLSLEAYDFNRPNDLDPHLRLSGRYWLTPNIYLMGGYDDPLVDDGDSVIFGGGIRWSDDDLKYLLGSVPKF
jgi:phospholipid/cholesterol/gamma-HCH transport system substrate-binding protein